MSQFGGQTKIEITADNKDAVSKLGATEQAFTEGAKKMSAQALGTAAAAGAILASIDKLFTSIQQFRNAGGNLASDLANIQKSIRGDQTPSDADEFGKAILAAQTAYGNAVRDINKELSEQNLIEKAILGESEAIAKNMEARTALARELKEISEASERARREELFLLLKIVPIEAQRRAEREASDKAEAEARANAERDAQKRADDIAAREKKQHDETMKNIEDERKAREKAAEEAVEQFEALQARQRAGFGVSSSLTGNAQLNALAQIQRVHRLRGGR